MTLSIEYESVGFPSGSGVSNGVNSLATSWDDLLWAALTVGRPNRQYVFAHGRGSLYEALFRLSLIRMTLEQSGPKALRLRRTSAARSLDPSEKGAINYFLGLTVAKHFADQLLDVPWLLHLDVFRPRLNAVLGGRSRPDLVGQSVAGDWLALECKGRGSPPSADAKAKAKAQAQRVASINGTKPRFAVGAIAYFRSESLQFFWEDPPAGDRRAKPIDIEFQSPPWREHYALALDLIRSVDGGLAESREAKLVPVAGVDLQVGIHPIVIERLEAGRAEDPRPREGELSETDHGYRRDGIAVRAGLSWGQRFMDRGAEE